jgi:hypothetical protein
MREICMASVDTEAEQREALAKGYRTFRVRTDDSALMHDETLCPASDEGGHRTTCSKCLLCDGAERGDTRRNVAILVHRTTMTFYRSRQLDLFEEKL